jgi:DNA mismatch repair protein MutL
MELPVERSAVEAAPSVGNEWLPASRPAPAAASPDSGAEAVTGAPRGLMPILRVVGQLAATYIIAEGPDGMYLIDQHAAHERVLDEQMLADRAVHRLAVQPLLEPLMLDLSPEQAAVVAEELPTLNELGVAIEPFGGSSYLVRSIPAILSRDNPQAALTEIVDGLARQEDLVDTTDEARLVTLICKRAAIKGGTSLSLPEMRELVQRLEACRSPRTCPHGRPTMVYMSASELARQFART